MEREERKIGDGVSSAEIPAGEIGPAVVRPASNSIGFESDEEAAVHAPGRERETLASLGGSGTDE